MATLPASEYATAMLLYIYMGYGFPEKFRESMSTPTIYSLLLPKYLSCFCCKLAIDMNVCTKFEVCTFTDA